MLNNIQHKRILIKVKEEFNKRASWDKNSRIWLDEFNKLNEEEQEIILIHFYNSQASTITKNINILTPKIHIPIFGNFFCIVQKIYETKHYDKFIKYNPEERQLILKNIFGTAKSTLYNPKEHNEKLNIEPTITER